MSIVLIVDDENSIRMTLSAFLRNAGYEADTAPDAVTACKLLEDQSYDIVVTDIIMPRMTGIELMTKVRAKSEETQVIVMTGEPTVDTAITAVQSGANDYLVKPVSKFELIRAVSRADEIKRLRDEKKALERKNQLYQQELEQTVETKTRALSKAMQSIISLLATVTEVRDPYTAGHQRRVGNLAAAIAYKLGAKSEIAETIRICGYLHDIGKIVVPSEILCKPGKLTEMEMRLIREHSVRGYELISRVELPPVFADTIYQHHERCDGSGYPRGLTGGDILPEAHVIIVADVVEAMMSHRPYRAQLGVEVALQEIKSNAGALYCPEVTAACAALFEEDHYSIEDTEQIRFPY